MTSFGREELWAWLKSAPLPVVLTICLTTSGGLTAWVWALSERVSASTATAQLAVEKAETAKSLAADGDDRLTRMDGKLDRLLVAVTELKTAEAARERKEKK